MAPSCSLGPDYNEITRRGADIVDKIIHGRKAADLPIGKPAVYSERRFVEAGGIIFRAASCVPSFACAALT